jgi:hypothetical protein
MYRRETLKMFGIRCLRPCSPFSEKLNHFLILCLDTGLDGFIETLFARMSIDFVASEVTGVECCPRSFWPTETLPSGQKQKMFQKV